MDVTIMPIIFTLLFSTIFGGAISGSVKNYLPIMVPGILLMVFMTSSSGAGTQLREDMDKGITNRFKSMPIARIAPLAGILIADLIRYITAGVVVFSTGYIMGYRPEAGIGAVMFSILFMMFITWCLSWLFAFIGISAKSATTVGTLGIMITFPLVFLSNAFIPTKTLPDWLQFFVVHINQLTKAVSTIRQILNHGTIGNDFWMSLLGALVILIVFVPLTLGVYKRKA
jgi:ABC-2 type transport system permease protein